MGSGPPAASPAQKLFTIFERVKGIEPSYSDWQPDALPLCYTRLIQKIESGKQNFDRTDESQKSTAKFLLYRFYFLDYGLSNSSAAVLAAR